MKKKMIGLFLCLCTTLSLTVLVNAGNEFSALTTAQIEAHGQLERMTDEQLLQSLEIDRWSIELFDRYELEHLTGVELDILYLPFRGIVDAMNARYGTNIETLSYGNPWWCREGKINQLTGYLPFDDWFHIVRGLVGMDVYRMRNNALSLAVVEARLGEDELDTLFYGIEYSYVTVADIAYMLHEGYDLREVVDMVESQISEVPLFVQRNNLVQTVWRMSQGIATHNHTRHYRLDVSVWSFILNNGGVMIFDMVSFEPWRLQIHTDCMPWSPALEVRPHWVLNNGRMVVFDVTPDRSVATVRAEGFIQHRLAPSQTHQGPWFSIFRARDFA